MRGGDDVTPVPGGEDSGPVPRGDDSASVVGLEINEPAESEDSAGPTGIDKILVEQYGYNLVNGKAVAPTD